MNGQEIPRRDKYDYLGVTIDPKLSWKDHISRVCGKANRTLGLVKRTLHAAPQQVRKTAYETLVRPSLEYATCAWLPHTQSAIKKVEQVQLAATRFVCGDYRRRSSVTSMCSTLEWDTLEQRRRLRDVTLFYKIKHGLVGITLPLVLIPADSRTRCQNTNKLRVVTSSCLTYQYSYFVCCVPVCNRRPHSSTVPDGRLPNHQSPVMFPHFLLTSQLQDSEASLISQYILEDKRDQEYYKTVKYKHHM